MKFTVIESGWIKHKQKMQMAMAWLVIGGGLAGCQTQASLTESPNSSSQTIPAASISPQANLSDRERSEIYQAVLAAELALANEQYSLALTHYLYALSLAPDRKIASDAIKIAQEVNDPDALIQASEAWLEVEPNHPQAVQANILGYLIQANDSDTLRAASFEAAYRMAKRFISKNTADEAYRHLAGLNRLYLQQITFALWQELVREQFAPLLSVTLLAHAQLEAAQLLDNSTLREQAERSINVALEQSLEFGPAIKLKVRILEASGRDSEAKDFLEALVDAPEANFAAFDALSQLYYRQREYDKGVELLTRWLAEDDDNLEARYLLAAHLYGKSDFDGALKQFLVLIDANYKTEISYYYCGDAAERINRFNTAVACYQRITSGKYRYQAKRQLSYILAYQGKEQAALDDLARLATDSNAERAEQAILLRADILVYLERTDEAINWLNRYLSTRVTSPLIPNRWLSLSYQQKPSQDWPNQVALIGTKLSDAMQVPWLVQSAGFFTTREQHELALAILNQGLERFPDDAELLYTRALMREPLGQPELLEQELRDLHKKLPDNPDIQNALGYTLADLNKDLAFAKQLIESAHQALPNSAAVQDSLGWLWYRLGDLEKAEQWLRLSTEQEKMPETGAHLIEVLVKQNKFEQAQQLLNQYWVMFAEHPKLNALAVQFGLTIKQGTKSDAER